MVFYNKRMLRLQKTEHMQPSMLFLQVLRKIIKLKKKKNQDYGKSGVLSAWISGFRPESTELRKFGLDSCLEDNLVYSEQGLDEAYSGANQIQS